MTEEEDGDGEKHIAYKDYRGLIREFPQIAKWALEGNDDPIPLKKIPDVHASKVTSGTLDATRLPNAFVNNTQDLYNQVQAAVMVLREHDKRIKQLEKRK